MFSLENFSPSHNSLSHMKPNFNAANESDAHKYINTQMKSLFFLAINNNNIIVGRSFDLQITLKSPFAGVACLIFGVFSCSL